MPKSAQSRPAGKGGSRRAPLTKCAAGTGTAVARPGSASSFAIIESLWRPNMGTLRLQDDFLVAQLADLPGRQAALGQDLVGVLAAERCRVPHSRRHPRELERRPDHGDLAERGVRHLLDDTALDPP